MITVDMREFTRLRDDANRFDKTLIRELRRRIKEIGQIGIDAVKKELAKSPPNDQPGTEGSRDAIAAGLKTRISFSGRSSAVSIVATNTRLDADHKGFVGAYETKRLKHPVYGSDKAAEVSQPTRPYFGAAINDALEERGAPLIMEAVEAAMKAIGAR